MRIGKNRVRQARMGENMEELRAQEHGRIGENRQELRERRMDDIC